MLVSWKARPQRFGEGLGGGIAISEDVNADQTHDRRDAVAVEAEIFEGFVLDGETGRGARFARRLRLLRRPWQCRGRVRRAIRRESCNGAGRRSRRAGWRRRWDVPCWARCRASSQTSSFWRRSGRAQRGVVGDVVAAAHEGVDGAEGFALAARQNEEGVVEILGRRARDAFADGVRHDELRRSGRPGHGTCCVPALMVVPPGGLLVQTLVQPAEQFAHGGAGDQSEFARLRN